jgi:hypothetical protein
MQRLKKAEEARGGAEQVEVVQELMQCEPCSFSSLQGTKLLASLHILDDLC